MFTKPTFLVHNELFSKFYLYIFNPFMQKMTCIKYEVTLGTEYVL